MANHSWYRTPVAKRLCHRIGMWRHREIFDDRVQTGLLPRFEDQHYRH